MNSIGVRVVLAGLLLLITTVKGDADVSFWRTKFTMTCPGQGDWYKDGTEIAVAEDSKTWTSDYNDDNRGLYRCQYPPESDEAMTTKKYYFYVKGKVCKNCLELDGVVILVAVVVDVVVTGGVILLVYRWAKRRNPARPAHTTKAPANVAGRAGPAASSSAYEELSAHTRSRETYSTVNRTG
ncbi:T-cell surface glycoprotein CD3 epsilon chain-like [Centroberyx affinis]|uniref:T-cell surface glycoprotein CD3 epsilon chain-like n=1 Tax=Centroberyx affinis TaxID=166261 RepID=UPI003A5C4353